MQTVEEVSVVATGDIMLGGTLDKALQEKGFRLFESVFLTFVNLILFSEI